MSFRGWFAAASFGLIIGVLLTGQFFFAIAPWLSGTIADPVSQQQRHDSNNKNPKNVTIPVAAVDRFSPWRDSYAQWLMMIFSLGALGVSYWAVRLLNDTLQATREAVRSAEDAVDVTRNIGEAQVRAYVMCSKCEVFLGGADNRPLAIVEIKNSGQSPAAAVQTKVFVRTGKWPEKREVVILVWSMLDTRGLVAGGTDQFKAYSKSALSPEEIEDIRSGTKAIFVRVDITYVDVFGMINDVEQQFAFTANHIREGKQEAEVASYGNRFRWGHKPADKK
jgi:hypothetical protein